MKKREIIKSSNDFNYIINNGKKASNQFFTIFYVDIDSNNKLFGVTTQKKCGNAVIRNRLKRQTKALIDENKLLFKNNRKYIIIIKKTCLTASYNDKSLSLKTLIGDLNEK
jgi:ribonuclease P protein component